MEIGDAMTQRPPSSRTARITFPATKDFEVVGLVDSRLITGIALLVLRCTDLARSKAFYEALGLTLRAEKHGNGPEHWACQVGRTVLELYPASKPLAQPERLGDVTLIVRSTPQ
jgi:hypothetical protein